MDFEPNAGERQPPCVPMTSVPAHVNPYDSVPPCTRSHTYRITKGYRRVPGDSCYGGAEWDAVEAPCPSWLSGSHIGKIIIVLLILIAVSLLVVMIGSKAEAGTPLHSFIQNLRAKFSKVQYKVIGGHDAPHSMAEDEAFYLSEDEFGPSPSLIDSGSHQRHSSIKPLPSSTKSKSSVPTLAPPS